jgi:hypothetical protein
VTGGANAAGRQRLAHNHRPRDRARQIISLPALPADDQPELLALPDGAILEGVLLTWALLPAADTAWCPVKSPVAAATMRNSDPQSFTVIGLQL